MSLTALIILLYALIGVISGVVMIVKLIAAWGLCSGVTMITVYLFIAALWPIAVPMILTAINQDKKDKEAKK